MKWQNLFRRFKFYFSLRQLMICNFYRTFYVVNSSQVTDMAKH